MDVYKKRSYILVNNNESNNIKHLKREKSKIINSIKNNSNKKNHFLEVKFSNENQTKKSIIILKAIIYII